ncbi:alpha/beta fold hydrolase [Pseudonocardia sp. CA-142604]|uniref:alpha/beta fold hydrolase n=1 Tax=Pseudonocardia sp. CA-142604 TaxID=3240024 RepID=UPI003D8AC634
MISRRRFAQAFAASVAATSLGGWSSKQAALPPAPPPTNDLRAGSGKNTSLGPVKQIRAGVLDIGYAEFGPATGPPVVLLHGWPYDPHSYVDVGPLLAAAGYRVIIPYLRGFGPTIFLSKDTVRNAQQSAVALDVIALMDALEIDNAILGGFDWGTRTADIIAALWPERSKALVAVSGYGINDLEANLQPLVPAAEYGWWYQYYFATERGVLGYGRNRHDFNKLIWKIVSPNWNFDDATYERTATSFSNPDHVDIVIHNYRWRMSLAPGEPQYDGYEQKLAMAPAIAVPTITIGSDFDGAAADGNAYRDKFTGRYEHRIFAGIGHNVPQEAPQAFAQAVIDVDHF